MYQKGSGPLASEQSFTFFLPKLLLKYLIYPDILKCEHFAGLRAQELKFVEVTVLRSRAYFVYFKVNEKLCLLSCHTSRYF